MAAKLTRIGHFRTMAEAKRAAQKVANATGQQVILVPGKRPAKRNPPRRDVAPPVPRHKPKKGRQLRALQVAALAAARRLGYASGQKILVPGPHGTTLAPIETVSVKQLRDFLRPGRRPAGKRRGRVGNPFEDAKAVAMRIMREGPPQAAALLAAPVRGEPAIVRAIVKVMSAKGYKDADQLTTADGKTAVRIVMAAALAKARGESAWVQEQALAADAGAEAILGRIANPRHARIGNPRIKWEHRKDPRGNAWVSFLKLPYTIPGEGPGTGRRTGEAAVRARLERDGWRIDNTQAVAGAWMPWEAIDETRYPTIAAAKRAVAGWTAQVEARGSRHANPRGRRSRRKRNPTGYPFSGDPYEGGTYRPRLKRGARPRRELTDEMAEIGAEHINRHEHETGETVEYPAPRAKKNPGRPLREAQIEKSRAPTPRIAALRAAFRSADETYRGSVKAGATFREVVNFEKAMRAARTAYYVALEDHAAAYAGVPGWARKNPTGYPFSGDPYEGGTYRPRLKRGARPRRELTDEMAEIGAEHINRHEHETGETVEYPAPRAKKNPAGRGQIYALLRGARAGIDKLPPVWAQSDAQHRRYVRLHKVFSRAQARAKAYRNPDDATARFLAAEIAAGRKDPASHRIAGTVPASRPTAARGLLEVQDAGGARRGPGRRKGQQAALFTGEEMGEAQRDLFGRRRNPGRPYTVIGDGITLARGLSKAAAEIEAMMLHGRGVRRIIIRSGGRHVGDVGYPVGKPGAPAAVFWGSNRKRNPGPFAGLARELAANLSPEVSAKINADPAMRSWATLKDMLEEAERRQGEPSFTPQHTARVRRYYGKARKEMLARLALHTGGQHGGPVRNPRQEYGPRVVKMKKGAGGVEIDARDACREHALTPLAR